MDSDDKQKLESNIPRRGRPRKNMVGPPPKSKSSQSGVRKLKPRAVKLVLPSVQAAVQNLAKVANKSSEIVKTFPIKDSTSIATFLLTPADGKTGTLAAVSKSASLPMTLVQQVTTSGPTSIIKQLPAAVSSNVLPRGQVPTSTGSATKLLLITTASNPAVSVPTTSTTQTLCKTLLPVKLANNTSTSGPVVAGNLGKQVLYKIPSSQSSGMVLLSTTAPSQSGGAPQKYLLIPSSTTTKRQANSAVVLNSKISHSVDPKPVFAIASPTQTACISSPYDSSKIPTTIVPISSLPETTGKKLTRQSAVKSSSPTKPVNTSRRRGSVLGANSTISSIPSGNFKTVACTTNSRGICSTPVSVQTSQKQSNLKLTHVGGLAPHGPLISTPVQQTSAFTQDASLNMTIPTVPQASLKINHLTPSPHCRISPVSKPLQTPLSHSDTKPNPASESTQVKRPRAIPGQRARKTIPKIDNSAGAIPSFITVPSSLPFSAIQLKPNCSNAALSASSFSSLSWVVSPYTGHQQKPSPNSENGTSTKGQSISAKYKNMPKLIFVNGVSNNAFPTTLSASSQTSNNDCNTGVFSANQYSQCSQNPRPIYASPPKLTIAPGFTPTDKKGSESGKKKRPSQLMIIKEREEFIDDSMEKSNLEDLSPPKLQREDEPDLNGLFNFEMPPPAQSFYPAYLASAKSANPNAQTKSNSEPCYLNGAFPPLSSSMTNQYQPFCHEIKPLIRKDNFPTLASLSAMNTELISRLDKNRKLSFGQLFNHFKLLADKKKNKKASSHSAIMFQVAHSIHCCVVLTTMDIEGSVDLNDRPFCVEESMNCSVKCRRTFMKGAFAKNGASPLLDPRFSFSILKPSDSTGEQSSRSHHSKVPTNSSSANEIDSLSSTVPPGLFNIKTELPDYDEYLPDHQRQVLTNPACPRKSTPGLTSEASTQKFVTDADGSFSSFRSFSTNCDYRHSTPRIPNPSLDCFKPKESSTSSKQHFRSAVPKEGSTSTGCNSCAKGKKRGRFHLCNGKTKKAHSSICSSELNTSYKIKNDCNSPSVLSPVPAVSPHLSSPQEFQLAGKLRYKIVPKGHISLSGKGNSPETESNCTDSPEQQTRVPVQSYIISGDKTTINPIQTITPSQAHPTKQHEDETKNITESQLVGKQKRKRKQPHDPGEKLPKKKIHMSKTKETFPGKKASSPIKSPKESCSKSPTSAKITIPPPERPASMRDPKHLYDEPSTADRVVMLTPDGKPILKDADLQITFDVSSLTTPKKKGKLSKGKSPVKSSETKSPSSISKNPSKSSSAKGKTPGTHSKRPPTLNSLLREIENKSKCKYLPSSSLVKTSTKMNDLCPKTYDLCPKTYDSDKSKKTNIEQIVNNIASGFPAFGPGRSRCTMKLYKYFVSTRIKNRAKKNGSHEIDAPLTLYINWKTISRQPFNKHRITNHALNVNDIKKAKQFSNYKKCKSRSRMSKPVKNRPLFMTRRKALLAISKTKAKTKSNNKSTKKTNKKPSKLLKKNWPSKKKTLIAKPKSLKKKLSCKAKTGETKVKTGKSQAPILSCKAKTEETKVKTEKSQAPILSSKAKTEETKVKTEKSLNSPELVHPIGKKGKSKTLVNKKDAGNKKPPKSSYKKQIDLTLMKQRKQINEKRAAKKALRLTHFSSLPVLRTTRSRVAQPETINADIKKLIETPSQIKTEPVDRVVMLTPDGKPIPEDTDLHITETKKPDTRSTKLNQQEILNEQADTNESPSLHPIINLPSKSKSKVADLIAEDEKTAADTEPDITDSRLDLKDNNYSNSSPSEIVDNYVPSDSTNVESVAVVEENQSHIGQQNLTSSIKEQHSEVLAQPAADPQLSVFEKEDPNIETPAQALSVGSASDPADENAEVDSQQQLASPNIRQDSGNFIFEDDVEPPLSPPSSCDQDKQLNSMHGSSSSAEDNQRVISNSPFTNITPTIRSSAFSDRFDTGLSPELARIQRLKDQLQEKQKALDLVKLYLK